MLHSKKKDDVKNFQELANLQSKVKQLRLEQKLRKEGVQHDIKEPVETDTKVVADTSKEKIKETKSTTKAIETLSQPNMSLLYPTLQIAFDQN